MKALQVDTCENFEAGKCKKCGRMMPALCIEFEEMRRKAAAYDKMDTIFSPPNNNNNTTERANGSHTPSEPIEAAYQAAADELYVEMTTDPYVKKAATRRGRPPKVKI